MAIDMKYGRVATEKGDIGELEPVVVFRAHDELLPMVLSWYHLLCIEAESPRHHLEAILDARERILEWQKENETKIPDTELLAP